MPHRTIPTTCIPLAAAFILAATSITGASIHAIAAPVSLRATPVEPPAPDAAALVRTALDRIGGKSWDSIKSYESIAKVESAMGDGRIEFRFIAPDARKLVQTMPGGKTTLELGSVGPVAWMGEPGHARAVDPRMAQELAGGGDLLTLVRSIDTRFTDFKTVQRDTVDGVLCWRISMSPVGSPTPEARWTLLIDASTGAIVGLDVPAPPKDAAANAPVQDGQSMRFRRWEPVGRGPDARPDAPKLLAFREATITTAGMKVDLTFSTVAVDTLKPGAIAPPEKLEPAPQAPAADAPVRERQRAR